MRNLIMLWQYSVHSLRHPQQYHLVTKSTRQTGIERRTGGRQSPSSDAFSRASLVKHELIERIIPSMAIAAMFAYRDGRRNETQCFWQSPRLYAYRCLIYTYEHTSKHASAKLSTSMFHPINISPSPNNPSLFQVEKTHNSITHIH